MKRLVACLAGAGLIAAPLAAQDGGEEAPPPAASPAHGYEPKDDLERGLWYEMDEAERQLKKSKFLIEDPALNGYVRSVLCRTVGDLRCSAVRLYLVRTPYFNASMAPNGAMIVNSGLLLRMRNEAQLAAVLGHEFTHFEEQHSLRLFRNVRAKSDLMSWLFVLPVRVPYAAAVATQLAIMGSVYSFNRDMEREADAGSIEEMTRAGYDPRAASAVWSQLGAEMDATAEERGHRSQKDRNGGIFATHPRSSERMEVLAKLAADAAVADGAAVLNAQEYRAALADWWPRLIDDQIALQDFGGTEYLLATLAGSEPAGWTGDLLYARGELYRARGQSGDFARAAEFFRQAVATGRAPEESWRGLGLALMRSGARAEGREALRTYLSLAPDAPDAALLASMAGEA